MRRTSFEGIHWKKCNHLNFFIGVGTTGGSLGTVIMDDLADRVPLFGAFYISPTRDTVLKIVNMEAMLVSNCGNNNKTGCFDWVCDIIRP